jgi:hypothetical protein
LQQCNRTHFGQAHFSPFTVPPLVDQLEFCGKGKVAEDIMNGSYDATDTDETLPFSSNIFSIQQKWQLSRLTQQFKNRSMW